jgi:hypothetical protein
LECGDLSPLGQTIYWPRPGSLLPYSKDRPTGFMHLLDMPAASRLARRQFDS